jgi:drug/metabolite transporter (DMT)-like permease
VVDALLLLLIACMWGSSFVLFKLLVPSLGFAVVASCRLLIGGGLLWCLCAWQQQPLQLRARWRVFTIVGVVNTLLPFVLFGVAAMHVPVAYSAVGNATAALWSAGLMSRMGEPLTLRRGVGLALGLVGVVVVAVAGGAPWTWPSMLGLLAGVGAALGYAIAGIYMRRHAQDIPPMVVGAGSQLCAAVVSLLLVPLFPPTSTSMTMLPTLVVHGVWCTALPYALFFPLQRRIGSTKALTVTFLMPVIAVALAWWWLDEPISVGAAVGGLVVCSGTALVLRK